MSYPRWFLGIQSKKDPGHVMTEVYKALLSIGCTWYAVNNYRILCAWQVPSYSPPKMHYLGRNVPQNAVEIPLSSGSGIPRNMLTQKRQYDDVSCGPAPGIMEVSPDYSSNVVLGSSPMSPNTRGALQQLEGVNLKSPKSYEINRTAAGSYESARGIAFTGGAHYTDMEHSDSPPSRELGISMSSVESNNAGDGVVGSKILRMDTNPDGNSTVKVALSLYNVQQHIYLLDFQKSEVNHIN